MAHLEIRDLRVAFGHGKSRVAAVDGVSLDIESGTVLGLVGESGSGKSTLARTVVGLERAESGSIRLDGTDLLARDRGGAVARAKQVQMIFQDPYSSLNPRMTVGQSLDEVLSTHTDKTRHERDASVVELLGLVRLRQETREQYPSQLSGGMRQRVAIARCLAVRPRLIVADEITSALDASVQGAVINLVRELQAELGLSMLFITHNLAVVRYVADRTAVMRGGRVVEIGDSVELVANPREPYTRELIDAIPTLANAGRDVLLGDVVPITRGLTVPPASRR